MMRVNNKKGTTKFRKLKILFVAAEVAPFSSVGGLSQVMYFLSRALIKLGHDVRIFTPKFGLIDEKKYPTTMEVNQLSVPTGHQEDDHRFIRHGEGPQGQRDTGRRPVRQPQPSRSHG